ncbi:MAG: hypothetical protein AB7O38_11035 [Pirellulaceae bacterium]
MKLIRTLTAVLAGGFVLLCTATVTAQLVGVGLLWSRGMLTPEKVVRYAGVVYGLEPLQLAPRSPEADRASQTLGRSDILAIRVKDSKTIQDRQLAIQKGTDDIRAVVMGLKFKRERQDSARKSFEAYLQQLEAENKTAALREIYATLELLPPKLAKDILINMLKESPDDPQVMDDVVAVLRMMRGDKLTKTIAEFRLEEEQTLLHEILVEIGEMREARPRLSGGSP